MKPRWSVLFFLMPAALFVAGEASLRAQTPPPPLFTPTDPGPRLAGTNLPLGPVTDQFGNVVNNTAQVPSVDLGNNACTVNQTTSQKQFAGCFLPNLNAAQTGL